MWPKYKVIPNYYLGIIKKNINNTVYYLITINQKSHAILQFLLIPHAMNCNCFQIKTNDTTP